MSEHSAPVSSVMTTEELLKPAMDDVEPRTLWGRVFGLHEHCFHRLPEYCTEEYNGRQCCHCGRREMSRLVVVDGHGKFGPRGLPRTMIWSSWKKFTFYDFPVWPRSESPEPRMGNSNIYPGNEPRAS